MLRKLLFLTLLALPLLAGCNQDAAKGGVAVVDLARVQQESTLVQRIQTHMEGMNQSLMTEAMQADQARKDAPGEESDKAFNETMTRLQETMYAEQERLGSFLGDELKRIMNDYRTEKGLDALLLKEAVASMDSSLDVTDEIMQRLDALDLELEALAAPEQPAVQAPEETEAPAAEAAE
ncbi:MAG: OmpH family outer membrane protein [Desulfovibrio sp.]|jgi:Skp family chaperone for outer membrane proteins|nr:OmpH family outer membrane protein [Desulfovibrio sp.]